MTDLDLAAVRERIERADGVTHKRLSDEDRAQAWSAFFDYAMDDLCDCLAEIDRLNATVQRVRELAQELRADIPEDSGNATANHAGQLILRALEGGEAS